VSPLFATRLSACLLILAATAGQCEESEDPVAVVQEGHWLEVRGTLREDGVFDPAGMELVDPGRYEELVGTIHHFDAVKKRFELLGQTVEMDEKTSVKRMDPVQLEGQRVKLEGYYRGEHRFSVRDIRPRSPGMDRILGRVDSIQQTDGVTDIHIMGYLVRVPNGLLVKHVQAVDRYALTESRSQSIIDQGRDEEKLFGKGIKLTDHLSLAGIFRTAAFLERNYDLDSRRARDIDDLLGTAKGRLVYQPTSWFLAVFEMNYQRLWRQDDRYGRVNLENWRAGETYAYFLDPFDKGVDFQVGRVDYYERRRWLYDQNLDGLRVVWIGDSLRAELSYTTTLSDGSQFDQSADNTILYVSNNDNDRHLAAYVINRVFTYPLEGRRTVAGFRMFGEWLPDNNSWLELARMTGNSGTTDTLGWGLDVGTTWQFASRFNVTLGYAYGSGDKPDTTTDETFLQTGLERNKDKFAGVTSFKYYGELTEPVLGNLRILTAGVGWLPRRRVSLDLVAHQYRQDRLSRHLVDMKLKNQPNGQSKDLGEEVDMILGWRTNRNWDLEVVTAWFHPGAAFRPADDAFFYKVQYRFRF